VHEIYRTRLDALGESWRAWGELGESLTDAQWSTPTRCTGWNVAAVYAHHSVFPLVMSEPPPLVDAAAAGQPLTAAEILRRFNSPGGVAHSMAETVAEVAITDVGRHTRRELVERFAQAGPPVIHRLRAAQPRLVLPWPASGGVTTLVEALRIVLMEATVHLLDIQRALHYPPAVPDLALADTARLLAEVASAVEFIEAATGRSTDSPLPVLR
jgi:uncharacterized protein (TIGR03083 family)